MPAPLSPKQLNALFERGNNFMRLSNFKSAAQDYSTVLEHQPDFAPAYFNRGFARQHGLGDLEGAIADYSAALQHRADFPQAYINRAIAYSQSGDVPAAIADYSAALVLAPDQAQAYVNRGELYAESGQYALAVNDFRAALGLKAGYRYALAGLAVSLAAQGELTEAQTLWRQLLTNNPNFADAAWIGGELGWSQGLVEGAQKLIHSIKGVE
jgi:tetratricopeptide (TPR) repeat protein